MISFTCSIGSLKEAPLTIGDFVTTGLYLDIYQFLVHGFIMLPVIFINTLFLKSQHKMPDACLW